MTKYFIQQLATCFLSSPRYGVARRQQFELLLWSVEVKNHTGLLHVFSKKGQHSIRELGYVQLYAIPTVALVGICCLVVTRSNQCFSASPVTRRFEAVANEAQLLYRPSQSQSQLSTADCRGPLSQNQTIIYAFMR